MMRSLLTRRRIASLFIEHRPDTTLHALDHSLVLEFYRMQVCSGAFAQERLVGDIRQKFDDSPLLRDRPHDIDRDAPRVKVEHRVRKDKKISRLNVTVGRVTRLQ